MLQIFRSVCFHFNPLPPRGGRLYQILHRRWHKFISIHSLRVEGDPERMLFRLPCTISIHSLRVEGDAIDTF